MLCWVVIAQKKALKEEEGSLWTPLHNLQEIETNTVFSDRVCV